MSNYNSGGSGADFHLPDEILSVIPTDPYDQLDLARKITSMAIASRVSKLESETGRLHQKLSEKERLIFELEEKVSELDQAFQKADSRLRGVLDENMKLTKERDSLAMTTKRLNRDLAKFYCLLETFKRQLMQSLNDDNSSQAETVDIGTCDQSVSKSYALKEEGANGFMAPNTVSGSTDTGNPGEDARYGGLRFSMTPYITPGLTPTGTPKVISTNGSPKFTSGTTSPTRSQYDRRSAYSSMSSWYSSSQQSSAANSPLRGRPQPGRSPRIDGKEFFRIARSRLSYEQFSAFLATIKELNAHKQSREDTLIKAEEIFGTDNKDLLLLFQGLINRKAT